MTDVTLMDLDDIAALYRCSRRQARDVITKGVGFPEIAHGASQRNPRWLGVEVREFLAGPAPAKQEKPKKIVIEPSRFSSSFADFNEAIRGAKRRASRKGRECDLKKEDAKALWERCKGACEITGIPFDFTRKSNQKTRPFSPSIDRIDNTKGYTKDNVRVVCTSVNIAMNQWGEEVLHAIVKGLIAKGKL